jgi:5-methylcytosine-specific restriction endonuclease McrA
MTLKGRVDVFSRCLACGRPVKRGDEFCITHFSKEIFTEFECLMCGKLKTSLNPNQKWCDVNCFNRYRLLPKNENTIFSYKTRWNVLERDNFRCRYCGRYAIEGIVLHVDHVNPKSNGGEYVMENLVTACHVCNIGKRDKVIGREILKSLKIIT